jgi:hypothetical protein
MEMAIKDSIFTNMKRGCRKGKHVSDMGNGC